MNRPRLALIGHTLLLLVIALGICACDTDFENSGPERFIALDIYIDPGEETLSAWQLEFSSPTTTIVGIEGGAAPFEEPPSYDPKALQATGKIILAAFTTKAQTAGRVHVARVHALERGPKLVHYATTNVTAARPDGTRIEVNVLVNAANEEK